MNTQMKTLMYQRIFNPGICRILFASFLSALCLIALSTQAATITVINTNDSGAGSLRQALADTNDGDTIDFAVTGTITLTTDELLLDKSITISGPGSDNLTVDGNLASRVFYVSSGVTATVAGLSITNGGEVPGAGGGIYNDHSTLAIDHCTVSGNHGSVGGGVYNDGYSGTATLTVTNSTFSGNSVAAPYSVGSGGGIYNNGSYGSATLTVANSTFSGNSAGYLDYGWGGAIYNDGSLGSATLTLNNSTFSGNSAGYHGGGIYNGSGMVTIRHTILNVGAWGENLSNAYGSVSSLGYNLSSDNGGGFLTATGDQINTDPMLGPLQDNGGSTFTHELLSGSPAINAGDPSFTPPPDYDQRGPGFPRVVNGRIDIGAFEEVQAPIYAAQVQQPINADGTSVFSVRRGVVPVKFTLTQGGVATCDLPPATIAVTRTAGGTTGQIDESVYSGSADTGSNFRIDSCQYIYNLSASALGVGTYRVDIQIDSQVVGSGIFQLK